MKKLRFLIGIHCHQPVGNFPHVFEEAYQHAYLPFIEVLEEHPRVKMSLHYSGPLLEWMEEYRPEFFDRLRLLVKRDQIDLLGGGFYEPILSALPERDAVGQLTMMKEYLKKKFDVTPSGVWLTERIWDPTMPQVLQKAGMDFTLLDDTHFYYAGLSKEKMFGHYLTERHGAGLSLFPIHKELRYSMPFKLPEETFHFLRAEWERGNARCVTFGDDGEKFGEWPGTYDWVYNQKWLDNFFKLIEENHDWLETVTFREHLSDTVPQKRVYLPLASYEEMMEWSLPTDVAINYHQVNKEITERGERERYLPFIRGGLWDNFFAKYEESNLMHKKMLKVSERVAKVKPKKKEVYQALYRAQCNCAYWHGLFGGLYLNYLRDALYRNLLLAETLMDKQEFGRKNILQVEEADFNRDGRNEIFISNRFVNVLFSPVFGGSIALLESKEHHFNVSNVLSRRKEAYHQKLLEGVSSGSGDSPASIHDIVRSKEEGLENYLSFDATPRYSFMEKIYRAEEEVNAENYQKGSVSPELDFSGTASAYTLSHDEKKKTAALTFTQEFSLPSAEGSSLEMRKVFSMNAKEEGVQVRYSLKNNGKDAVSFRFGYDVVLTLLAPDADDRYVQSGTYRGTPRQSGALQSCRKVGFIDEWSRMKVVQSSDVPVDVWLTPLETVSQSEDGFEKNYQGTIFYFSLLVSLEAGEELCFSHNLTFQKL